MVSLLVDLGTFYVMLHMGPETIIFPSCLRLGHVIPPSHLLPLCLCKGPAGEAFEFTFQNRDKNSMVDDSISIAYPCSLYR